MDDYAHSIINHQSFIIMKNITTQQISELRACARKNENACMYFQQKNATFKVKFYDNGNFIRASIKDSQKRGLLIINPDTLTDEILRVVINSYFKRALKAD